MRISFLLLIALVSGSKVSASQYQATLFISSHLQCTSPVARESYRGLFSSVVSATPSDWNLYLANGSSGGFFSSLTNICMRKTNLDNVKSFVAQVILSHIQDARIASDGLGKEASNKFRLRNAVSVIGQGMNDSGSDVLGAAIGAGIDVHDDRVNWTRPDFDVAFKRLLFLRYGLKGDSPEGQKLQESELVPKLFNIETLPSGLFGWNEIKTILPHVAAVLDKTIQDMWIKKYTLEEIKKAKHSGTVNPEPILPSAVPTFDINNLAVISKMKEYY